MYEDDYPDLGYEMIFEPKKHDKQIHVQQDASVFLDNAGTMQGQWHMFKSSSYNLETGSDDLKNMAISYGGCTSRLVAYYERINPTFQCHIHCNVEASHYCNECRKFICSQCHWVHPKTGDHDKRDLKTVSSIFSDLPLRKKYCGTAFR